MSRKTLTRALLAGCAMLAAHANAEPERDYDFEWVTVGIPGNAPVGGHEVPKLSDAMGRGCVDHAFRLTRTHVTTAQWLEFVEACAPYYDGPPIGVEFSGAWIYYTGDGYEMLEGTENAPTTMSWHMAARYVNWLHNGKIHERWAFEDGVYDTSTFTQNPDGSRNDQLTHHPDARFWIPTYDELVKAAYYDPNRYGPGEEGYWMYPNRSNEPLVPGMPGSPGAETSAGIPTMIIPIDAGSYPDTSSYFGLLDMSGGVRDLTGDAWALFSRNRVFIGSFVSDWLWEFYDRLDFLTSAAGPWAGGSTTGLRIASIVPACNPADLAEPYGVLDIFDVIAFFNTLEAGDHSEAIAEFMASFEAGCAD